MNRINPMMIIGVIINFLIALTLYVNPEFPSVMWIVLTLWATMGITGIILTATIPSKVGAIVVIVSAILFVPIGLIATLGARKAMDEKVKAEFEKKEENKEQGTFS
jgi:hypothetical protein